MLSATALDNKVAAVLKSFASNLEPDELLRSLNSSLVKGDMDNNTLGHAYYTLYYGRVKTFAPVSRPTSSSLFGLYSASVASTASTKTTSMKIVKQTDPTVYVASVCDAILPHHIIPAPMFCQAIRDMNPHEFKNDYYHLPTICGYPFDAYLEMVNVRLRDYFSASRSLDDVLSGIKKCLCLRILSNNMYYYRDHTAGLDPAIQKLMQFYTLTDFLHASSQEVFDSHVHMIQKYKQLKELIEEFIKPEFKRFLREIQCGFHEITRVEPGEFVVVIRDDSGTMHELPHTLPMLQAFVASRNRPVPPRMSSSDMVHKVQSYFYSDHPSYPSYFSNPRLAFNEGIRFMQLLMTRLYKGELTLDDRTYNDLFKIYELTLEALLSLHKYGTQTDDDDEKFLKMMKKMDRYNLQYHRPKLTSGMVDWSKFAVAGPARSPSPLTRKRSRSQSRSRSRSRSRSEKRRRLNGGAARSRKFKPRSK